MDSWHAGKMDRDITAKKEMMEFLDAVNLLQRSRASAISKAGGRNGCVSGELLG